LGVAGLRLYQFEEPHDSERASQPVGTEFQTGASPLSSDPIVRGNWRAIANAGAALEQLTPYLLGTAINSPAYGNNIVTAARVSPKGRMLMIVNDNDWQRTLAIDLSGYVSGPSCSIIRISAYGFSRSTGAPPKLVALEPGETIAFLSQP